MPSEDRVTAGEGALLLHALCWRVAHDNGLRVLAIKGPAVAMQGLRAPRRSGDVDVLVHPEDLDAFVDALVSLGWHKAPTITAPRIMPAHALNLLNERWPLGIDVHHFFPGYLDDAAAVFEELWRRRVSVEMAGVPVLTCDPVTHASLVALHLLRDDPEAKGSLLADLRERSLDVLGPHGVAELPVVAARTGAVATLRPFLLSLGIEADDLGDLSDSESLSLWRQYTTAPASLPWVLKLAETPKRRWPREVWRAVMLSEEEIRAYHSGMDAEASVTRMRWRRIRRGMRTLPRALWLHLRRADG